MSAAIADEVLDKAIRAGDNVVLPRVGKNFESMLALRDLLTENDYRVHLVFADLPIEKAVERAIARFRGPDGRFVDPDYIYNTVGGRPASVYDELKKAGGYASISRYSTDVPRGAKPRIIERLEGPDDSPLGAGPGGRGPRGPDEGSSPTRGGEEGIEREGGRGPQPAAPQRPPAGVAPKKSMRRRPPAEPPPQAKKTMKRRGPAPRPERSDPATMTVAQLRAEMAEHGERAALASRDKLADRVRQLRAKEAEPVEASLYGSLWSAVPKWARGLTAGQVRDVARRVGVKAEGAMEVVLAAIKDAPAAAVTKAAGAVRLEAAPKPTLPERIVAKLDKVEADALAEIKSLGIPRDRSSGATILPQLIVAYGRVLAARAVKAGIKAGAEGARQLRAMAQNMADEYQLAAGSIADVVRVARTILRDTKNDKGEIDPGRFEEAMAKHEARLAEEPPPVKKRVRSATGQTVAEDEPATVKASAALRGRLKAEERGGRRGFREGVRAGKEAAAAEKPETLKRRVERTTGVRTPAEKVLTPAGALLVKLRAEERASGRAHRQPLRNPQSAIRNRTDTPPMLRPGHVVFLCALALLCVGVVMVNSAGMNIDPVSTNPAATPAPPSADPGVGHMMASIVFSRSTIYMGLAVLAMSAVSLLPIHRLAGFEETTPSSHARLSLTILVVGALILIAILATAYIPGLSRQVNGSRRWITVSLPVLGATSVQPSEIVKWALVIVLAAYGACRASLMPTFTRGLAPGLFAAGLVAGAVAHEDLGTGVLLAAVACVILLAAGARFLHFLFFIPPAIAGFVALVITNPYRLTRIEAFFNPYLQPQGSGYHMIQSMIAIAGGEGAGRGLGYGLQKFGYLPEDTTDFLFPIICEELGIAGAALVIFLYVALLWAGLGIIRRQPSLVLKLIAVGVLATVGLQALINLVVVTGLGPTKGIALPLLSSGGTGWILTAASLGLLIAMDRSAEEAPTPHPLEPTAAVQPLPS